MADPHVLNNRLAELRSTLDAHGQSHVLQFADELDPAAQQTLLDQVGALDFGLLNTLIERYVRNPQPYETPTNLDPAPCYPCLLEGRDDAAALRQTGEDLIRGGKVAAFTVAGGQGTRLGWNGPKGTYPATPITGKPLFRLFAEQILAAQKKYGITVPWYIMTSPANDADTRAFFQDNRSFGLDRASIFMFPQGMMPSMDPDTGRILLATKSTLALNPDGHGGSIRALLDSGAIEDMLARGIEHISYFQVDNPLVRILDPTFLGVHAAAPDSSGEMSSKMVPKVDAAEKVGVFCNVNGRTQVIEYSDLPDALTTARGPDGDLLFRAGNCAIHLLSVAFIQSLVQSDGGFGLPWHRAVKKVSHVDDRGEVVTPAKPNAVKLEMFVFDALPLAKASVVYETRRTEEFAPIKNADGVDSPATSFQLQSDRAARWLETRSVNVARDAQGHAAAQIEISALTALDPEDLDDDALPDAIGAGEQVVL